MKSIQVDDAPAVVAGDTAATRNEPMTNTIKSSKITVGAIVTET